jgi:hypothetical protein
MIHAPSSLRQLTFHQEFTLPPRRCAMTIVGRVLQSRSAGAAQGRVLRESCAASRAVPRRS